MVTLRRDDEIPKDLESALIPGEVLVIALRSHWARLAKPVAISVGLFAFALFMDLRLTARTEAFGTLLWWLWLGSLGYLAWHWLEWRHDWFVGTDKRLLLRYGLITNRIAMMPLVKVTDMSYNRSVPGRIFGYGKFVMESAGQDQAMREVPYVRNPDKTYKLIGQYIFNITPAKPPEKVPDTATGDGPGEPTDGPDGPDRHDGPDSSGPDKPTRPGGWARLPRPRTGGAMGYPDVPPTHNPVQDRLQQYSQAIPVRRPRDGESIYQSEDIKRRRKTADTGPVPLRPRHEPRAD